MDTTSQYVSANWQPSSNGHYNEAAVAENLQEDMTPGYKPSMPLESLWMGGGEMPQITLRRDLEFMQMHPVVMTALEYYKAGVSSAEFWGGPDDANPANTAGLPISQDPAVAQFVLAHARRFWQVGVPVVQDGGYSYGWGPGEHIYREIGGMMTWSHVKGFHPNDSFLLTLQERYTPVGCRVKGVRDKAKPVDLWFSAGSIPAKGCWYAHRPRFNQFYGRSQLTGAWRPWRRLGWRDGVEQVIDAAIYRAGYVGPIVRHPREDMQTARVGIPGTQLDSAGGSRRSARDVARQMVEWAKAGAGFTLSSEQYPPQQGGGKKWDVEFPDHVMDVRPLIEAARTLEDQIMLGIGVPPELIRAGGTGSGYSGRSIPREAFLDGQQLVAEALLQMFVEQVIRPLVLWNYGDVPFSIHCKSLLQTQAMMKMGEGGQPAGNGMVDFKKSDAAKKGWDLRKLNDPTRVETPQPPMMAQAGAPMSIEDVREQALNVIYRVLARRAA